MIQPARSERLHKLLIEVEHGDLWENGKSIKSGWCEVNGEENDSLDFEHLAATCHGCMLSYGRIESHEVDTSFGKKKLYEVDCPLEWGFLTNSEADLNEPSDIGLFALEGPCHIGRFFPQRNLIQIDELWLERVFEKHKGDYPYEYLGRVISHETIHCVLERLFPSSCIPKHCVTSLFDNVANIVRAWDSNC